MNIDQLHVVVSNFINDCEMVMVSKVAGFNVNPIKPIMMSNFVGENFFNVGVLEFRSQPLVNVRCNKTPVFFDCNINFDLFVSHILK